jgi:hypothetical protein
MLVVSKFDGVPLELQNTLLPTEWLQDLIQIYAEIRAVMPK